MHMSAPVMGLPGRAELTLVEEAATLGMRDLQRV